MDNKKAWVNVLSNSLLPVFIGIAAFVLFCYSRSNCAGDYCKNINKGFEAFLILFLTYWVYKISAGLFEWYAENIARRTKSELDDKFLPLFKRSAITIIWIIGLVTLLSRFGVNISALVAALGVSSLAVALAAQDTIANIISGFLIMIDQPFCAGDTIKLPSGERVKVLDIGIRRTKFIAEDNAIIIMPNLELSKSKIVNYTYTHKNQPADKIN